MFQKGLQLFFFGSFSILQCALFGAEAFSTPSPVVPKNVRLLILPGFGNDSKDYTMDKSMVSSLMEKGWSEEQIAVLPVERTDWLQVFLRGALDIEFWKANAAPTRPAFSWYLERIATEISELKDDERIVLLGHSAGGWLGRAAVGFGSSIDGDDENSESLSVDISKVAGIVTLGSPNLPPPPGVMDMTRGALRITHETFPGAYHAPDLFYVTAIGLSVAGEEQKRSSPLEPTTLQGFAFNSYEAVCGDGTVLGDGVVPQCAGHLEEALQLDLDGVLHSINAPDNWYGSIDVIDRWHTSLLQLLVTPRKRNNQQGLLSSFELPFANLFKN